MRRVYGHISSVVGNCVDRKKVLGERERGAGSVESCFPKSLLLPPSPPKTDLFPERGCIRLLSLSLKGGKFPIALPPKLHTPLNHAKLHGVVGDGHIRVLLLSNVKDGRFCTL